MAWIPYAAIAIVVWNLMVFAMYSVDKKRAKRGAHRIRESTLISAAALLGAPGALFGMFIFRHKTKHAKFIVGVPLLLIINIAVIVFAYMNLPSIEARTPEYRKITSQEAAAMLDQEGAVLLDVRTEAEYAEGHIEGALLIPDYEITDAASVNLPDKNAVILIYCRTGRRSEMAARALVDMGYTQVYDFGGIVDWPYEVIQ